MERRAKRPQYLPLPVNRDWTHWLQKNSDRYFIAWITNLCLASIWKLKFFLKAIRIMMLRRKVLLGFITVCLISLTMIVVKFRHKSSLKWTKSKDEIQPCSEEQTVYINGRLVCQNDHSFKYLSYQPPGGGWNNQRVAFENAVVLAKLLNRTLIVHPLAPHQEILRLKRTRRISAGYEIYNMLTKDQLLPLSRVIDLKLLSKLIPIKEITASHNEFKNLYKNLKWARICHNGLFGTWIDAIPKKTDDKRWRILRRHMRKSSASYKDIPLYRRICNQELKQYQANASIERPVWGIMDELFYRTEDLIYFAEGSLYSRELLFFERETVLNAHEWIMRFIRFAPNIRKKVANVLEILERPYNAIHVRRTDHPSSALVKQDYWLWKLKQREALNLTKTLYIATDERNKTWFDPFRDEGYNLFFAEDVNEALQLENVNSVFVQDLLGLCEQFICAHADHFVGSYYSTFTMFIKRLRMQFSWKKEMLRKPYTSIIWTGSNDARK